MRIVTYNIRKSVGLDWRRAPDRIAKVLFEIDADVIVLQEADKRLGSKAGVLSLDSLEENGYRLAPAAIRPESHGWHGNAIFVRHHMWSGDQEGCSRLTLPKLEPRGAVSLKLDTPNIVVVGMHLGLTSGMRRQQLKTITNYIKAAQQAVIVAGDFNTRLDQLSFDAQSINIIAPGPSFHTKYPLYAFDGFLTHCKVELKSAWVHRSKDALIASDHLPVVAEIGVKN